MKDFKIELSNHGASILVRKAKKLYDEHGNQVEVVYDNHRSAIGISDYESISEFRDAVVSMVEDLFGNTLANGLADIIIAVDNNAIKEEEMLSIIKEKDEKIADMELQIKYLKKILPLGN